ncbi:MAG: hypothetical protein Q8R16_04440 [bacterium]|nr:hypothetical protein [bacterium]
MSVEPLTRVVLSDIGNVLVRATHAITWAILENLGVSPKDARRFFDNPAYAAFARGEIDGDEFADQTVHHVHATGCLRDDYRRQIRVAHDAHIYDWDRAVDSVLMRIMVPLMYATDTNAWQMERVKQLGVCIETTNRVFRSDKLGCLKREAGTFDRIAHEIGEEPRRICFVDDDAQNVARAARAGFDTVRFTDAGALVGALQARRIFVA